MTFSVVFFAARSHWPWQNEVEKDEMPEHNPGSFATGRERIHHELFSNL